MSAGATILAPLGQRLSPEERMFFRDADPWGFILFERNVSDADGTRALAESLREAVGRDAAILVDQEGGRVQRLRPPLGADWLPPLDHARRAGDKAERAMYLRAVLIAAECRAVGIDANCAPCADIAGPGTHPFLRNRCYGTDAETVTRLSRATAEGHLDAGVLPVLKHVPGHGRATADSHKTLPRVEADLATLEATDFAPFRALGDLPLAMTAHLDMPALSPDTVTVSKEAIGYIRETLGVTGLLMTDDISMQALSGTIAERAAASIAAGCDVILHCNGEMDEMAAAVGAAGRLAPAAAERGEAALAMRVPPGVDLAAAGEELADILEHAHA